MRANIKTIETLARQLYPNGFDMETTYGHLIEGSKVSAANSQKLYRMTVRYSDGTRHTGDWLTAAQLQRILTRTVAATTK